jgi:hypothetical protein
MDMPGELYSNLLVGGKSVGDHQSGEMFNLCVVASDDIIWRVDYQ